MKEVFFRLALLGNMNETISHIQLLSLNPNQIFVGVINNKSYNDKT